MMVMAIPGWTARCARLAGVASLWRTRLVRPGAGLGLSKRIGRLEGRGSGGGARTKPRAIAATGRSSGCCGTVRWRSEDRPARCADAAGMQYGIAVDRVTSEGRTDSAVNGRCGNGGSAERVLTSRTPATRRRWDGAASGMLAAVLEAFGADQRAFGPNPIGGNGLDGQLADLALRSGRVSLFTNVVHYPCCAIPRTCPSLSTGFRPSAFTSDPSMPTTVVRRRKICWGASASPPSRRRCL